MGNLGSSEYQKIKKNTNLSYTATGRHTSPNIFYKKKLNNENKKYSFNSKIYEEVFPPVIKKRNTITPLAEINVINNISDLKNHEEIEYDEKKTNTPNSEEYEINYVKTGEDIRRSYLAKLIYQQIWVPDNKNKIHNSLIIFDWDDTLLPTTFLTPNGTFFEDIEIEKPDLDKLKKLETSVMSVLKKSIEKAETFIITNAAPGWVEYSSKRFYPEVSKLLHKINIISARGEFEKKHPGDSRQWKILAFQKILDKIDINLVTNMICLGDSVIEMEAAHILASKLSHSYIKTIKFRESPKPDELNKQLNLVIDQFDKILGSIKNLTIKVDKKPKEYIDN